MTPGNAPQPRPSRRFRIILYTVLTVVLLSGFAGCAMVYFGFPLPSSSLPDDAEMMQNFKEHRQEFDELVRMLEEDGQIDYIGFWDTNPSWHAAGLDKGRLARYRSLMRKAGFHENWGYIVREELPDSSERLLFVTDLDPSRSDNERGYAFSERPPVRRYDSLDDEAALNRSAYRHIDGEWYLYRWYEHVDWW